MSINLDQRIDNFSYFLNNEIDLSIVKQEMHELTSTELRLDQIIRITNIFTYSTYNILTSAFLAKDNFGQMPLKQREEMITQKMMTFFSIISASSNPSLSNYISYEVEIAILQHASALEIHQNSQSSTLDQRIENLSDLLENNFLVAQLELRDITSNQLTSDQKIKIINIFTTNAYKAFKKSPAEFLTNMNAFCWIISECQDPVFRRYLLTQMQVVNRNLEEQQKFESFVQAFETLSTQNF